MLIHLDQLARLYQKWLDFSMDMRSDSAAESVIQGWVQADKLLAGFIGSFACRERTQVTI